MIKLYFKKLLFTMGFFVTFFLFIFIIAFVWHLFFGNTFSELNGTLIYAILALVLNFTVVCVMRYERLSHKTETLKNLSFFKILFSVLKSRENIVHTVAFISLLLPFFVSIAKNENTPFLPLVFGTVFLLLICGLIFLMVNALMWSIVHKLAVRKYIGNK